MINREHPLPLSKQCQLMNISRSIIYYQPVGNSTRDLELMRLTSMRSI